MLNNTPSVATAPPTPPGALILFAIAFGIAGAGIEITLLAGKQLLLNRFIGVSWMMIWMTPMTNVGFLLIIALVVAALTAALRRRDWTGPVSLFLMAWLTLLSPLLLFSQIHVLAAVVLAAGAAIQVAKFLSRRQDVAVRMARRTVPWMVLIVVAAAIGIHGNWWLLERRLLAQMPASATGAPNVLIIILDTVRARSLGLYGLRRPTSPKLEGIAAEGVHFDRAITPAPWTLPTHGSIFSGLYPRDLDGGWLQRLAGTHPTLAGVLGRAGYATAGFVANYMYTGRESGIARDFVHYDDYQIYPGEVIRSSMLTRRALSKTWFRDLIGYYDRPGRRAGQSVSNAFLDWMDTSAPQDRPFFAFLNYYDAHAPYLPPQDYAERFDVTGRTHPLLVYQANWSEFPPEELQNELNAYEAGIALLDDELGRLIARLDSRGILENTLLVITSDHGEEFNEHGQVGHGDNLYLPVVRVPLVMRFPALIPAGVSVDQGVGLADLPATILDLVGIRDHPLPGVSFANTWSGGTANGAVVSEQGEMRSILEQDFHLLVNVDDQPLQLFDIDADPLEQHNLLPDSALDALVGCLLARIETPRPADRTQRCVEVEALPDVSSSRR